MSGGRSIDLEVLWRRLSGIADEVATALVRTSFSMIVRDAHDYSCAICDPCGHMLVQASHGIRVMSAPCMRRSRRFLPSSPRRRYVPVKSNGRN